MGCDIHPHAERKVGDRYEAIPDLWPFDWRSYGMFAFLAGVRNYSDVPPLSEPRGLPDDISDGLRGLYDEDYRPYVSKAPRVCVVKRGATKEHEIEAALISCQSANCLKAFYSSAAQSKCWLALP